MNLYLPVQRSARLLRCGLLLSGCLLGPLPAYPQPMVASRQAIPPSPKSVSVGQALRILEKRFDVTFGYAPSTVENRYAVNRLWNDADALSEALDALLGPIDLTWQPVRKDVFVIKPVARPEKTVLPAAQDRTIRGRVKDENGEGIPGASVQLKGTTTGTVSDNTGAFSLSVPEADGTLVISFVGYATQEIALAGRTSVDVILKPDVQALKEVMVVGYGTQEKKDVTGAVAEIKGSDIQNLPSGGAQQALQGRAAGVNVIRNGGAPGNAGSIQIRGLGTVNGADPLVVIDGVPSGTMNDVNPNDIESIDVLKDASASAIYGTRAANGVVIITTKRGKFDHPINVSVNGYAGVSNRIKTLPVLDAPTYTAIKQEAYTNDGLEVPDIWKDKAYQTQKTNWQDALFRQGSTVNYDVSLRGGGKYSSFSISGGYYGEDGIIGKSYYRRYNFRVNSDHKIGSRLKIGQNFQFTNTHDNAPNTTSSQTGLLWSAIRFHPGLPIRNADGSYSSTQGLGAFGDINNPIYTVDNQDQDFARNRFLGNLTGEFEILPGLKARANLALDATFSENRTFEVKVTDQFRTSSFNQLTLVHDKYWSMLQEYFLSYDRRFGKHSVSVVGGYTAQTFNDLNATQRGRDFASEDPSLRYLQYAGSIVSVAGQDGGRSYDALASWFGRLNYGFRDRYLLTATLRADGSSKFAPGRRWGYFPAFSVGWRVSEEPFFQSIQPVVNSLKLTAGWGQLGNQNVGSFQYLALINTNYRYAFGGGNVLGSAQSRLANTNIGWETAEMSNFGLESSFFNHRLTFAATYFIKDTRNMLLAPPSLGTIGSAAIPDQNVGQMRNQGLELELGYRKTSGDFTWHVGANATLIRNEVTRLATAGGFLAGPLYGRGTQEVTRTYQGHPYGTFYGYRTSGLYQTQAQIDSDPNIAKDTRRDQGQIRPGDVRFVDLNGDGLIDDKDRTILGSPQPKITYGLNAGVTYKQFDLSLFFVGVGGVSIYNADRMQGLDASYSFNLYQDATQRWHGENTSNTVPRVSIDNPNRNFRPSDLFVERGDFLRLKNLVVGYNLPKDLAGKLKLSNARIYVTGQNVFTLTKYSGLNPELGYVSGNRNNGEYIQPNVDYAQYPLARTWTAGLSLTF
ncbi:SusC/RagA family TonB-linked outer membrane protein [Siphonobacter aquaeclarae]|uniref:TonB-linked outer membrane protein, SusC/RagA family n=1 Tax=Siphonobacter aquaeclarae TaxID=563176 RepID=A0A1G9LG79_9BACT|nr:TonB-dependent receptor [Siphonobacter aquaeclarae]SDL60982.1 TonB-linked outer membrane protein, SusC/RagA family [Siphonobacter aquaeclarae]